METTRITITASLHRNGKRIGQQMLFDTISQAEQHFADSDGVLHVPLIRVKWNEKFHWTRTASS